MRDKFSNIIAESDLPFFDLFIAKYGLTIKAETEVDLCRDEKDNLLLSLATKSMADFLIPGDQDLLKLYKVSYTKNNHLLRSAEIS